MKQILNQLSRILPVLLAVFISVNPLLAETNEIKAFSIGYGRWVAYPEIEITGEKLKPFIGEYLLAGNWPKGINRPDDPALLLGREKIAAIRIVSAQVEKSGRMILLTTDPAVSPDEFRRSIGDLTISATFQGISAKLINNTTQGQTPNIVIPFPTTMEKLVELSKPDTFLNKFIQSWKNQNSEIKMQFWARLPEGLHAVSLKSAREFEVESNGEQFKSIFKDNLHRVEMKMESAGIEQELKLHLSPAKSKVSDTIFIELTSKLKKNGKSIEEEITASNFLVPWAPEPLPEATVAIAPPPYELGGGNAIKGKEIFYSQTAKCANCHAVRGEGGKIGPDLSELKGKDASLVFHHINAPSDRIHPGYPSFTVALKSGQVAMGVVRSLVGNELEVLDTDAKSLKFSVDEVEELKPSTSSIMPQGLAGTLGESAVRDLIAFLTSPAKGTK